MKNTRYNDYLQSEAWRVRRKWKLEQADFRCQVCNAGGELHVHHRTYDRLGSERENDLTVLCQDCHGLFHGKVQRPDGGDLTENGWHMATRMYASGLLPVHPGALGLLDILRRGETYFFVAEPEGEWAKRDDRFEIIRTFASIMSFDKGLPKQAMLVFDYAHVPPAGPGEPEAQGTVE